MKKPKLDSKSAAELFFSLLENPDYVSAISSHMVENGFSERNMVFQGNSNNPGDQISLSRWVKAASGALIVAMRYDINGQPEILFGRKKKSEIWVLPGGHYELDEHCNLEHSFVAELMEETGIIPHSPKLLPYIDATLSHAKDILPYDSIEAAKDFVSERFSWHLETVLSGANLGYNKRIILAVYSIVFHDGNQLNFKAGDDLVALKWFNVKQIIAGDHESNFDLSKLAAAHYQAVKHVLLRMGHF